MKNLFTKMIKELLAYSVYVQQQIQLDNLCFKKANKNMVQGHLGVGGSADVPSVQAGCLPWSRCLWHTWCFIAPRKKKRTGRNG